MSDFNATASTVDPPPRRSPGLGWRLAVSTSVIVAVVMGMVTLIQELYVIKQDRETIQAGMREALVPLVEDLVNAESIAGIKTEIAGFHAAYVGSGSTGHHLILRASDGELVASTLRADSTHHGGLDRVDVHVATPVLGSAPAALTLLQDNERFWVAARGRWQHWAVHFAATLVTILIFLQITIRRLVTAPLERLLEGIRKTEMGYWGDVEDVEGAWEIRWINWRFRMMGKELKRTVGQLLEAQRRSYSTPLAEESAAGSPRDGESRLVDDGPIPNAPHLVNPTSAAAVKEFLKTRCRELELSSERNDRSLAMARAAFSNYAILAERLGEMDLKYRLEDAAFAVLEPDKCSQFKNQVATFARSKKGWLAECMQDISRALDQGLVPFHSIDFRIKHVAGVWRKMVMKGLTLDQVHDLFALRIIVPTETDCYWALRVVHDSFIPVVGRFKDYIASPKANGYQSIHTCVQSADGQVFEIQIRSISMHEIAENGSAAHADYKQASPVAPRARRRVEVIGRRLLDMLFARPVRGGLLWLAIAIVSWQSEAAAAIPWGGVDRQPVHTTSRLFESHIPGSGAVAMSKPGGDTDTAATGRTHDHAVDHGLQIESGEGGLRRRGRLHPMVVHFPIAMIPNIAREIVTIRGYRVALFAAAGAVTAAGHLGATLVFGEIF